MVVDDFEISSNNFSISNPSPKNSANIGEISILAQKIKNAFEDQKRLKIKLKIFRFFK